MSPKEQWLLIGLAGAMCLGVLSLYAHHHFTAQDAAPLEVSTPGATEVLEARLEHISEPAGPVPVMPIHPGQMKAEEGTSIAVSIAGAVHAPGVYEFPEPARIQDLLAAAGGPREDADLSDINLAARLIDGSTLTIPARGTAYKGGDTLVLRRGEFTRTPNLPQYTISGWRPSAAARQRSEEAANQPVLEKGMTGVDGGLIDLNRASVDQLESLPGIGPKLGAEIVRYRTHTPFLSVDDVMNVSGIGPKRLEAIRPLVTVGGT